MLSATLEVETPGELLARHYPNGKLGGLTVDGRPPGALGQRVALAVRVRRERRDFLVQGQLAWAKHRPHAGLPPRFGVDFLPDDEHTTQRLLAFAREEVPSALTRIEPRVAVELPVRLVHAGQTRREFLADLSTGGAFVRTWDPLPPHELVELTLRLPRSLFSTTLQGRVAWARREGHAPGMGIEFLDPDGEQRRKVEKLLARLGG